jgi:SP family sugar:H+ symporter-like MFS transporter
MTDKTEEQINLPLIAAIVGVATIGGFMFGYDSGAINGTFKGLAGAFGLDESNLGFVASTLLPGCALGAFAAGRLADIVGRRNVMLMAALLFIVSALVTGGAGSATIFAVARFFAGVAVGAASVLSPAYISEVTPAHLRGRLSSVQQVMIIVGLAGAATVNWRFQNAAVDVLGASSTRISLSLHSVAYSGKPTLPGGKGSFRRSEKCAHASFWCGQRSAQSRGDQGYIGR